MMSNIPIVAYAGLSFAWTATVVIGQAVAETGAVAIFTQLGVFAICGIIAYWFLRRESSDRKERTVQDALERTELRDELIATRLAHEETRKLLAIERQELREDLKAARIAHDETRQLLMTSLVSQSTHAQLKVVEAE